MLRSLLTLCSLSLLCACPPPAAGPAPKVGTGKATTIKTTEGPTKDPIKGPTEGAAAAMKKAAGVACLAGSECASGICEGQGCDAQAPGTCAPAKRMCTRDLRAYCGCDAKTFQGSGSCPGRRYSAPGPCKAPAKLAP